MCFIDYRKTFVSLTLNWSVLRKKMCRNQDFVCLIFNGIALQHLKLVCNLELLLNSHLNSQFLLKKQVALTKNFAQVHLLCKLCPFHD